MDNPGVRVNAPVDVKYIEGDEKTRAGKCMAEIQKILDRFDCAIVPRLDIVGNQMQHSIALVVKDRSKTLPGKILTPQGMRLE